MSTVTNADGLTRTYGTTEGAPVLGGKVSEGQLSKLVIDFAFGDLSAFSVVKIMSDNVLPDNIHIKTCELYVPVAFVGATATLSIGLVQADDRSTDIGTANIGLDDTIAITAIDAIGDTIACDGAIVGTTITESALVTMLVGTANMTAGQGILTIEYWHTA